LFREPDGSQIGNEARADDTDQGERLGGVHAVLYPPAIAVLKRGERGGGGFGIKDGIKQAGRKEKVPVRQRIIARFDPSRPRQNLERKSATGVTAGVADYQSAAGLVTLLSDKKTRLPE